jgi:hypothetical protein
MCYDVDDDLDLTIKRSNSKKRSFKYFLFSDAGHIPNKHEAETLRKIMAETNLTEEEIREIPKYKKQLSIAQKKQGNKSSKDRTWIFVLKQVLRKCKLPKEHPDVRKLFKEEMIERQKKCIWPSKYIYDDNYFTHIINIYKK